MKIGIAITALAGGRGPARFTQEIIRALAAACDLHDEFLLYGTGGERVENLPGNCMVRKLPLERFRPWLNWTLPRAAGKDRIDVMFFPANDCWLRHAAPAVVVLHDMARTAAIYEYLPTWKDRLQVRLQMRRIGAVAEKIITVSQFSAAAIAGAIPGSRGKTVVIHNGLSAVFIGHAAPGTPSVSEPYLLFVGGFDRRKNLERLLQAFKLLADRGRKEKLRLVGSGGANRRLYYDMPALVSQYGLEDRVRIQTGVGDAELAGLYAGAALLVLPSTIEGFGLPVIEAQACGCPVACSNAGSLPEIGGDGACYFDPYDVSAMADGMEKILKDGDYRLSLREKGLNNARRFSWEENGRRVYAILREAGRRC